MSKKTETHWLESRWQVAPAAVDSLQLELEQMGSLGSYENLDLDPEVQAKRVTTELIAYFPASKTAQELADQLKTCESDDTKILLINMIPQGNWATEWKKYFKPFFLTKEVVIRPSWEEYQKQGDEIIVTLDPGMAFGTGQHDTTRFCAELICELKKAQPQLSSLLDIGCGSGILSIIAKKIGFTQVTGIDNDPAAVETALENLDRNPECKPIDFFLTEGSLDDDELKKSDVVVSNIIAETLVELKNGLVNLVNPHGYLILSGIMPERAHLVKSAFADLELTLERTSESWHAYVYRCK